MKQTVERKICDLCLDSMAEKVEGQTQDLPVLLVHRWIEVSGKDVCPYCAQIIYRASQMGLMAGIVAEIEERNV